MYHWRICMPWWRPLVLMSWVCELLNQFVHFQLPFVIFLHSMNCILSEIIKSTFSAEQFTGGDEVRSFNSEDEYDFLSPLSGKDKPFLHTTTRTMLISSFRSDSPSFWTDASNSGRHEGHGSSRIKSLLQNLRSILCFWRYLWANVMAKPLVKPLHGYEEDITDEMHEYQICFYSIPYFTCYA